MADYLVDTQLLVWSALSSPRLSRRAVSMIGEASRALFSPVSIAEVGIKYALRRPDFDVEPALLRRLLLDNDYTELPLTGEHAVQLAGLPPIHKDPFDRLLVAQARAEGVPLLTADATVARYGAPVMLV